MQWAHHDHRSITSYFHSFNLNRNLSRLIASAISNFQTIYVMHIGIVLMAALSAMALARPVAGKRSASRVRALSDGLTVDS